MLNQLRKLNPEIEINSIFDNSFNNYGKVIQGYAFSECIRIMQNRSIPAVGNTYVACDNDLNNTTIARELFNNFYGSSPIQIGYCNGNSNKLNALEYHKCSEIDVAVTDLVLILGDIRDINQNRYLSSLTKIFYVPANTAIELYSTTLHFAPCKVSDSGYKSIIVLPEGTNKPLSKLPLPKNDEDMLLWMQNKWLIAHEESIPASKGAFAGIIGYNIEIKY
jgi:hypothetical protein